MVTPLTGKSPSQWSSSCYLPLLPSPSARQSRTRSRRRWDSATTTTTSTRRGIRCHDAASDCLSLSQLEDLTVGVGGHYFQFNYVLSSPRVAEADSNISIRIKQERALSQSHSDIFKRAHYLSRPLWPFPYSLRKVPFCPTDRQALSLHPVPPSLPSPLSCLCLRRGLMRTGGCRLLLE